MKKKTLLSLLLLVVLVTACKTDTPSTQMPSPEPDLATIHGRVLSEGGTPLQNTSVRLADVYRGEDNDGAFALDEAFSPSALSDEDGFYIFNNINPGEYVLFFGSINSNYMIVANEDGSAIVYKVSPNEVLEIEPISVNFK